MLEVLSESKLVRTLAFSLVAGFVALAAFVVLGAAGVEGLLGTVLAVAAGLTAGLALENAIPAPD